VYVLGIANQPQVFVSRNGKEAWATYYAEITLHWTEEISDIALIAMQKVHSDILCPHIEKLFPDIFFCEEIDVAFERENIHESKIHSHHG
jgi:hypothetical protein